MGGIYIKGMEMPKSCPCELLGIGYDLYCSFAGGIPARVKEYYECCQNGTRPSWCPLAPVPPHGRLIEYHAAVHAVYDGYKEFGLTWRNAEVMLGKLPTIIPAEEGEEE